MCACVCACVRAHPARTHPQLCLPLRGSTGVQQRTGEAPEDSVCLPSPGTYAFSRDLHLLQGPTPSPRTYAFSYALHPALCPGPFPLTFQVPALTGTKRSPPSPTLRWLPSPPPSWPGGSLPAGLLCGPVFRIRLSSHVRTSHLCRGQTCSHELFRTSTRSKPQAVLHLDSAPAPRRVTSPSGPTPGASARPDSSAPHRGAVCRGGSCYSRKRPLLCKYNGG